MFLLKIIKNFPSPKFIFNLTFEVTLNHKILESEIKVIVYSGTVYFFNNCIIIILDRIRSINFRLKCLELYNFKSGALETEQMCI